MGKTFWKGGNMLNPLPVVMVSAKRPDEKANIITLAWTGTICSDPPMVSISVRRERYSYDMIKETGEFVINLVTEDLARACDYCGVKSGRNIDKFKECRLTECASDTVAVPSIAESPVSLECKVKQVIELGSHDMFLAEVTRVAIDEKYVDAQGRLDFDSMKLVSYSHGDYYKLGEKIGKFGYSVAKKKPGAKA